MQSHCTVSYRIRLSILLYLTYKFRRCKVTVPDFDADNYGDNHENDCDETTENSNSQTNLKNLNQTNQTPYYYVRRIIINTQCHTLPCSHFAILTLPKLIASCL